MVVRFLVVWDIFRHTFSRTFMVDRVGSKMFSVVGAGSVIFALGSFWTFQTYGEFHSVYPALERSFSFAQAAMVLWLLIAARYYGIQLGRNVWGIAVAFGAWVSISTANNAVIDLQHSFLPYWQILRPLSFVLMLALWTWAVWIYAPNPPLAVELATDPDSQHRRWEENWNRTMSTIRRAMHP